MAHPQLYDSFHLVGVPLLAVCNESTNLLYIHLAVAARMPLKVMITMSEIMSTVTVKADQA